VGISSKTDSTVPDVDIIFNTPGGVDAVAARIHKATFTFTGTIMEMFTFMVFEIAIVMVDINVYGYRGNNNAVMGNIDNTRKSIAVSNAGCVINVYLYRKGIRTAYVNTGTPGLVKLERGGMGAGNGI